MRIYSAHGADMNKNSKSARNIKSARNSKLARNSKKATNITLPGGLVDDAKSLGINVSQACEIGLNQAVKSALEQRWLEDNKKAIEASNQYVRENGVPFAKYRQF